MRTRVGYAGGTTPTPTYASIGNHSETVEIEFDPKVVSYRHLLDIFWHGHDSSHPAYSTQYRSAILYVSEEQRELAEESKAAEQIRLGKSLYTSIEQFSRFYAAEDYHQKYYLKQRPDLAEALHEAYPDPADFRDSTAAARLNGKAGGYDETYCPAPVPADG